MRKEREKQNSQHHIHALFIDFFAVEKVYPYTKISVYKIKKYTSMQPSQAEQYIMSY